MKFKRAFTFYRRVYHSYDKMLNDLPLKDRNKSNEKIYLLARFNIVFIQLAEFAFILFSTSDIILGKYTYDSLKGITIANWTVWSIINILTIYSVISDKPRMMLFIHNLLLLQGYF